MKEERTKLLYSLQMEKLKLEFPNAIFPTPDQSLPSYLNQILVQYLHSYRLLGNSHIKKAVTYLLECNNLPYFISATKDIYPYLGKQNNLSASQIERILRHAIHHLPYEEFPLNYQEILALPPKIRPTNMYFLANLTEYTKIHYIPNYQILDHKIENQMPLLSDIEAEYDIITPMRQFDKKRKLQYFLYKNLGFFKYQYHLAEPLLIDFITYQIEHNLPKNDYNNFAQDIISQNKDITYNSEICENIIQNIRHSIYSTWTRSNPEMRKEVFGIEEEKSIPANQYVLALSQYTKKYIWKK